ncbi:MAG: GNAT family N-acetyltransferase [Candidatus Hermodarchaeota archaeon]
MMSLVPNSLNYTRNTSIWKSLEIKLVELFQSNIKIIFPDVWNDKFYNWYHEIEKIAFRENLRYSYEEVKEKLANNDILFFFILSDSNPEAFILGYSCIIDSKKLFFLDTIAVKKRGQGIGTLLIKYLSNWLEKEKYLGIKAYTEEIDEKHIMLQGFYEKLGFALETKEPNGNLVMILWF